MDHHTPITTTAFDQENQLLLNAIKNKFAAHTANEAASFSPPKFTIPTLKTFDGGCNAKVMTISASAANQQQDNGSNQLNQFLLKQLQQTQSSPDITKGNGFEVPQLQFGKEIRIGLNFDIPLLKSSTAAISSDSGVSSLTTAINKLQVQENDITITPSTVNHPASSTTAAIDLTSALASKSSHRQGTPPTRDFQAKVKQTSKSDFVIPFIDCDRLDNATARMCALVQQNEHCLTDISQLPLKPLCKEEPSPVGKFLYLVDKRYAPVPLKCITSAQRYKLKVKHVVEPFQFDTKSPDDKVLESLSKYRKR